MSDGSAAKQPLNGPSLCHLGYGCNAYRPCSKVASFLQKKFIPDPGGKNKCAELENEKFAVPYRLINLDTK